MLMRSYSVNNYCTLMVDSTEWKGAIIPVLIQLFYSVMDVFNNSVGVTPQRRLQIQPDPNLGHPMCSKCGSTYIIYLSARENYWSKYVYQFAHEYCHYLIDGPLDGELETTFWFEESICELASMYLLLKVTKRWESWNPIMIPGVPLNSKEDALMRLKGFAPRNNPYLKDLLNMNPSIDVPLSEWLDKNMEVLSEREHHRDMYNQIACALFGLFIDYPDLWKMIPFLRRPSKEEYTDFRSFINKTLNGRIDCEIEHFPHFVEALFG